MLTGKDRGKTAKVIKVDKESGRVAVDGLNLVKKNVRPKKQGEKGEIVAVPRLVDASNVALVCGSCKAATRVGYREEGEVKVRYCKKCRAQI